MTAGRGHKVTNMANPEDRRNKGQVALKPGASVLDTLHIALLLKVDTQAGNLP